MATWMAHFRIADHFLDRIEGISAREFVVGNIGPDCGEPNDDWSAFTPPPAITHWYGEGNTLRSEDFYKTYLGSGEVCPKRRSFYMGYYVHLLTDTEWIRLIGCPKQELYQAEFAADEGFIWKCKRDWYDLDHLFRRKNPEFRAFSLFSSIQDFKNEYLDYFSPQAIQRKIDYISGFYKNHDGDLEHDYPYLNEEEMDRFVKLAADILEGILREKGLLKL
jgi:hypothetical protein